MSTQSAPQDRDRSRWMVDGRLVPAREPEVILAELKTRISAAQRARVRAEHERDAAQAAEADARRQLAEEFGVHNVGDAKTRLAELEAELNATLAALRAALEEIGG